MKKYLFPMLLLALFSVGFTASGEDDQVGPGTETPSKPAGYPDDSQAEPNPEITDSTTTIPNPSTSIEEVDGVPVVRIDLTGIKNAEDVDWMKLYGILDGDLQNVWVEVDGTPKGFVVVNNSENEGTENIPVDIVFTVDNSSSMTEEADAIARDIKAWAEELTNSGLNVRFGVVGYGGYITGAIDMTTANELSEYLDQKSGYMSTTRTQHFGGANAAKLEDYAKKFPQTGYAALPYPDYNECGALAIEFADQYFTFRSGANRVYVNFTDEPNQPNYNSNFSVKFFEDQSNWPASNGTVHTVYSAYKFDYNNWNYQEQPWLISEYTGGTTIFTSSSFSGVTLSNLPVTGAMQNSYIIRIGDISDLLDGNPHLIHITIISKDGSVQADKTFWVVFE